MRLAVLDIGSNTVHMVVVDGEADGSFVPVGRERDTLRLAEGSFPARELPERAGARLTATVARTKAAAAGLDTDLFEEELGARLELAAVEVA